MLLKALSPLIGVAALFTGCGLRAVVEYDQISKPSVPCTSQTSDDERREQIRATRCLIAVDAHTAEKPEMSPPVKAPVALPDGRDQSSSNVIKVDVGTINLHVGDIHFHTDNHVHITQIVDVPQTTAADSITAVDQSPSPKLRVDAENVQCERLRREHEARVAAWNKLFE
ncbi:MAG: hypothetical protein ACKVP0_06765 [Pirellulaceae bacterium]